MQLHTHASIGQVLHSCEVTGHKITSRNRSTVHAVTRGQPGAMLGSESHSEQRKSNLGKEGLPSLQVLKHRREKPHARQAATRRMHRRSIAVLDQIRWRKMYSQVVGGRPSPLPRWKEDLGHAKRRCKQHDAWHTFKLSYLPLQDRFSSFGNTSSHLS